MNTIADHMLEQGYKLEFGMNNGFVTMTILHKSGGQYHPLKHVIRDDTVAECLDQIGDLVDVQVRYWDVDELDRLQPVESNSTDMELFKDPVRSMAEAAMSKINQDHIAGLISDSFLSNLPMTGPKESVYSTLNAMFLPFFDPPKPNSLSLEELLSSVSNLFEGEPKVFQDIEDVSMFEAAGDLAEGLDEHAILNQITQNLPFHIPFSRDTKFDFLSLVSIELDFEDGLIFPYWNQQSYCHDSNDIRSVVRSVFLEKGHSYLVVPELCLSEGGEYLLRVSYYRESVGHVVSYDLELNERLNGELVYDDMCEITKCDWDDIHEESGIYDFHVNVSSLKFYTQIREQIGKKVVDALPKPDLKNNMSPMRMYFVKYVLEEEIVYDEISHTETVSATVSKFLDNPNDLIVAIFKQFQDAEGEDVRLCYYLVDKAAMMEKINLNLDTEKGIIISDGIEFEEPSLRYRYPKYWQVLHENFFGDALIYELKTQIEDREQNSETHLEQT